MATMSNGRCRSKRRPPHPFWDALAQHRIVIQYSPSSQAYVFYPRVRAPRTLADDLEWREISGMGTLYSFTVARRPVSPHFADAVPQLLAIVEWDEGPRFSTEMVNVEPDAAARRDAGAAGVLRLPRTRASPCCATSPPDRLWGRDVT